MISGQKILITGVSGMVATPLAHFLAQDNEVWGIARFADPEARAPYEAAGITTRAVDIGSGDFSDLPDDFTHVLHLSWMRAELSQMQSAIRTNVEGAGLLFQHCRKAKATLVMSGMGVYSPSEDPWHAYTETDPIGRGSTAYAPTSPMSKIGVEMVARYCARAYGMPMVITRLNTFNGTPRSFPALVIRSVLEGRTIHAPSDPNPHTPIHAEDMKWQLEALLDAASTPAFVVNWCGDETVPLQDWARWTGEYAGLPVGFAVNPSPGAPAGTVSDPALRRTITGPCRTVFRDEFRKLYDAVAPSAAQPQAAAWTALSKT
jgi:nucleoside-diphosphate-sugar epimerase